NRICRFENRRSAPFARTSSGCLSLQLLNRTPKPKFKRSHELTRTINSKLPSPGVNERYVDLSTLVPYRNSLTPYFLSAPRERVTGFRSGHVLTLTFSDEPTEKL